MSSNPVYRFGKAVFLSICMLIKVPLVLGIFTGFMRMVFSVNERVDLLLHQTVFERFISGFIAGGHTGIYLGAIFAALTFFSGLTAKSNAEPLAAQKHN